jgi:hypothetical protein
MSGSRALADRGRVADKICCMARRGCWAGWAGIGPVGSDFFFFFCFLISFITFIFFAPNELKLISKFFKKSTQYFKTIKSKFS